MNENVISQKGDVVFTPLSPQDQAIINKVATITNTYTPVHQPIFDYQKIDKTLALISTPEDRAKPVMTKMDEQIEILQKQLQHSETFNIELQTKLEEARIQLKQLNDKESIQTGQIRELRAELREEASKREAAETQLSVKEWKTIFISFVSGIIVTVLGGVLLFLVTKG